MIGRLKFDISDLVTEMLDQLPDEVWSSDTTTFLDPCMGGGQFVAEIERRLIARGHAPENVAQRVHGFENNLMRVNYAINKHKLVGTYSALNFLEAEVQKKFDVIVGNPPYLKRMWMKFLQKALGLSNQHVAFINPDPLSNKSAFGDKMRCLCAENGLQNREDVTEFFSGISSGRISSFIFDKNLPANQELFRSGDPIYDSILEKITMESPQGFVLRGQQAVSGYGDINKRLEINDTKTEEFKHPAIMSCRNDGLDIKYTKVLIQSKKHKDNFTGRFVIINRFFGKNNPDPVHQIDDIENYNLSYDCLAFKLYENESIDAFYSVYGSKTYRYVMNRMRNGGFDLTQGNLMRFFRPDLTQVYTEDQIYKILKLTQEEIEYIESFST